MTQYKKFKIGASYVIRGHLIENNPNGIFVIMPTKRRINAKDANVKGMFNYVSRGTTNNGIASQIQYDSQYLNDGHTLSFAQDTAAIFYQDEPYFTGNKVNVFKLNDKYGELTRELGLYLASSVRSAFPDFKWGMMLNIEKIANTDILLPVTPAGDPDFEYMTMRIRELEAERIRELEAYLRVTGLGDTTLSTSEAQALTQNVKWKKFKINNFFKVLPVKHKLIKRELLSCGQYPCYSSDTSNYGILGYTNSPEFNIDDKHSYLIFGDHTRSMRIVESDFSVLDNVKVLCGQKLSKEKLLFIETMWHKAIPNLGYARHWSIAKNVDFLLPVTSTGDVDFDYMQNYIRAIEKQTIKGVVEYKDRVIAETKKVVGE